MTKEKANISDKITELNTQVEWFYSDDFSLDEASEKYQAAIKLAKDIEQDLNSLKNEIELISKDFTKE
ncbi:exodeoxyribonuclease VII small subunit [Candidatus Saccharibacteria bacterium]|nr:exodeoxyribonuclease VII small subunit [Candidatus Saccharibacteria bacterium]